MENSEMTIAEAGKDPRHFREFENRLRLKSVLIIAFPLILKNGTVYGVVEIIDTSARGKRLNLDERYLRLLKGIIDTGALALSNALNYREQLEKNQDLEHRAEPIFLDGNEKCPRLCKDRFSRIDYGGERHRKGSYRGSDS
jgi:hypothetical protein